MRSLTKRSVSTSKSIVPDDVKSDDETTPTVNGLDQDQHPPEATINHADDSKEEQRDGPRRSEDGDQNQQKSSPEPKRFSATSNLDNVNLDDEVVPPSEGKPFLIKRVAAHTDQCSRTKRPERKGAKREDDVIEQHNERSPVDALVSYHRNATPKSKLSICGPGCSSNSTSGVGGGSWA